MAMISRRKIISRSQSELDYSSHSNFYETEDDVWFNKDKLFQDHISEILKKWDKIDDEIWAKIIVMERNRRIAKAYARAPAISINGSESGFDGYSIGMNGFEPNTNDPEAASVKKMIGKGVKLRMDDNGNILIKRVSRCGIIIKSASPVMSGDSPSGSSAISPEILKNDGRLEIDKPVRLFDMKKFITNIDRELRNSYPDRKKLENQCIILISFARDANDILDLPSYVMIINIVAIDMLKSRIPNGSDRKVQQQQQLVNHRSFNFNDDVVEDEDEMYASFNMEHIDLNQRNQQRRSKVSPSNGSKSNGQQVSSRLPPKVPPKLPPRNFNNSREPRTEPEDPYYCGLQARVPNFGNKQRKSIALPTGHHPSNSSNNQFVSNVSKDNGSSQNIRKTNSNGYLNSLFNSSSTTSNFLRNKFSKAPSGINNHLFFNSHHGGGSYYDSSLESDGYSGGVTTSGSGYDGIYAPIPSAAPSGPLTSSTGYGRYNNNPRLVSVNNSNSHHLVNNSSRSNHNNNNTKSIVNHRLNLRQSAKDVRAKDDEDEDDENISSPFEPHTQRYATEWD